MKKYLLFLFPFIFISCNEPKKKPVIEEPVVSTALENKLQVTENKVGILKIDFERDTLWLVTDGKLTWDTFAPGNSYDSIKKQFPDLKESDLTASEKTRKLSSFEKALYSDGMFLFFEGGKLKGGHVENSSVKLAYDIQVGMYKSVFFKTLFHEKPELWDKYNKAKVVVNSDPPGEDFDTYFVFKGERLDYIEMRPSH